MSKTDNDHEAILIQTKSIVIYKFKNCSFLTPGEHDEVWVPRHCINGTIRWNYPTEYAIVHFSPNTGKNFFVCIGKSVYKFELFDITGGIRQPISYGKILLKNTVKVYFSGSWQRFWKCMEGGRAFKKSWKQKTKTKTTQKQKELTTSICENPKPWGWRDWMGFDKGSLKIYLFKTIRERRGMKKMLLLNVRNLIWSKI